MNEKFRYLICPKCQTKIKEYKNPFPIVDIIIEYYNEKNEFEGIVLIERKNEPYGWAIPGGFVEYGETAENTAIREAKEETGLDIKIKKLFNVYSAPERDPRFHTITTVFIAEGHGKLKAADDAKNAKIFKKENLPEHFAFDHKKIIEQYFASL